MTSFDTVEIREYPVVLGNNPECHYGPSIELGWDYRTPEAGKAVPVDDYERRRPSPDRRTVRQLYLSQVRREKMTEASATEGEVKDAVRDKGRARRRRRISNGLRGPLSRLADGFRAGRRGRRVRRAVRNLKKGGGGEGGDIYRGWWLPFSAYMF